MSSVETHDGRVIELQDLPPGSDLSKRARKDAKIAIYLLEHYKRLAQPYDAISRPNGYIPLCVAENKLMFDLLGPKLAQCRDIKIEHLGYNMMTGSPEFRQHLAAFFSKYIVKRPVDPSHLAVLAGAGTILECLFWAICQPGDGVLLAAPFYPGFLEDCETQSDVKIIPVNHEANTGFRHDIRFYQSAYQEALARGERVSAVLVCSPNNPMGRVMTPTELVEIMEWANQKGLHVVVDEIYALSVFGSQPFVSAASLVRKMGNSLHIVWAFSKDWSMSGVRCGLLYTQNAKVLMAISQRAYWAAVSSDTQYLLGKLVSDFAFVDQYTAALCARLARQHAIVVSELQAAGIPFIPSDSGMFLMVDLRQFLPAPTSEGEMQLYQRLLAETNVNMSPGLTCVSPAPGFFRLCFASVQPEVLKIGIQRLCKALCQPGSNHQ